MSEALQDLRDARKELERTKQQTPPEHTFKPWELGKGRILLEFARGLFGEGVISGPDGIERQERELEERLRAVKALPEELEMLTRYVDAWKLRVRILEHFKAIVDADRFRK